MNIRSLILIVAVCCFLPGGFAFGAEVQKIGIVDLQDVMNKSDAGKEASEEIKAKGTKMEDTLKQKGAEIEELRKKLDQKALVMSDEAREAEEDGLRGKINELKSLRERYQGILRELNVDFAKQFTDDVFEVVEEIGKRGGYALIIDRRAGGVVYAPNAIDISDEVIKEYNSAVKKRGKKASPGESKEKE